MMLVVLPECRNTKCIEGKKIHRLLPAQQGMGEGKIRERYPHPNQMTPHFVFSGRPPPEGSSKGGVICASQKKTKSFRGRF